MRFLTRDEVQTWVEGCGVAIRPEWNTPDPRPEHLGLVRFLLPQTPGQVAWLARFIAQCLGPRSSCLLWVTEWGVWPSSENWHLYYRLRQSYGDLRLLHEAPGHLFLNYEEPDLTSFLELGILSGWDIHVLPILDYGGADTARAFVSHDEWVMLGHRDAAVVSQWTAALQQAEYRILRPEAA